MLIELNDYGFIFDSSFTYLAINWLTLITLTALLIGIKAYRYFRAVK
jgi:hypothetical protein